MKSRRDYFITPPDIPESIPIDFDLDPCLGDSQPWKLAKSGLTRADDGLETDWSGVVWCHPPHEDLISAWMKKNAQHNNSIAFYIANMHTKAFQKFVYQKADGILFLRDRQRMYQEDGTLGEGGYSEAMVLVSYGKNCTEALKESNLAGTFQYLSPSTSITKIKQTTPVNTKTLLTA